MNINYQIISDANKQNIKYANRTKIANRCSKYLAVCIALEIFALGIIASVPERVSAYSTDHLGREVKMYPIVNPAVTDRQAMRWVESAVIDLMSIGFDKYDSQIPSRERYFYGDGFQKYKDVLYADVVPVIVKDLLIVTAINSGQPILARRHNYGGVEHRTYLVEMLQTTQGPTSDRKTDKRVVIITVGEVHRDVSIYGLQIKRFNVKG